MSAVWARGFTLFQRMAVWSNPAGNGSAKSLSSNNWATGDYYQFTLTISDSEFSGLGLSVYRFDQTGSNTGPKDFQLSYKHPTERRSRTLGPPMSFRTMRGRELARRRRYPPTLLISRRWKRYRNRVGGEQFDSIAFRLTMADANAISGFSRRHGNGPGG